MTTIDSTVWACESCGHIADELEYAAEYCPSCKDETAYEDVTELVCPECDEVRSRDAMLDDECDHCNYSGKVFATHEAARRYDRLRQLGPVVCY